MQSSTPIDDLFARLERERLDADRAYHQALAAVDAAVRDLAQSPAPVPVLAPATTRLAELNASYDLGDASSPRFSRGLRGRLERLAWRLVAPVVAQQVRVNALATASLNAIAEQQEALRLTLHAVMEERAETAAAARRLESQLVHYVQTVTAYIDTKVRRAGGDELRDRVSLQEQRVLGLKREMERLVAARPDASALPPASTATAPEAGATGRPASGASAFTGDVDSTTYLSFEQQFRGSEAAIAQRVADYVPMFRGAANVLDVGCGRGEFLEALQAQGITARGIDVSPAMVATCQARGLQVTGGDALDYVRTQPDGTLGGLIALQVVEHFNADYLVAFLEAALHALRPGAPLVLETINPACWMAFFETYIRDLTHRHPLHPDTLRHLVQSSGFTAVDVQYRAPVTAADRLEQVALPPGDASATERALAQALNAHAEKLNGRLFSSMDYVVVARRP